MWYTCVLTQLLRKKVAMNDQPVTSFPFECLNSQTTLVFICFLMSTMESRPLAVGDSSWVLRPLLVQGKMPVSWRVSPQIPHWSELSLLFQSAPLTRYKGFLGLCTSAFLPFFAVTIVLFPLLTGRGGAVSVIMVKAIPQAFTMFEFTPVVITGAWRPPNSFCGAVHDWLC